MLLLAVGVALIGCPDSAAPGGPPDARSSALIHDLTFDGANAQQNAINFWQGLLLPAGRSLAAVQIVQLPRNEGNISGSSGTGALQYRDNTSDSWKNVVLLRQTNGFSNYFLPNGEVAAANLHNLRYVRSAANADATSNTFFAFRLLDGNRQTTDARRLYFRRGTTPTSSDPLIIASDITSDDGALYFSPQTWTLYPGSNNIQFQTFCTSDANAGALQARSSNSWGTFTDSAPVNCSSGGSFFLYSINTAYISWPSAGMPFDTSILRFKPAAGWSGTVSYILQITNAVSGHRVRRSVTIRYRQ